MCSLTRDPENPGLHVYLCIKFLLNQAPVYDVLLVSKSLQYQGFDSIVLVRLKSRKLGKFIIIFQSTMDCVLVLLEIIILPR